MSDPHFDHDPAGGPPRPSANGRAGADGTALSFCEDEERAYLQDIQKLIRRQVPVEDYLSIQKRFGHLFSPTRRDDVIARVQAQADKNIRRYGLLEES